MRILLQYQSDPFNIQNLLPSRIEGVVSVHEQICCLLRKVSIKNYAHKIVWLLGKTLVQWNKMIANQLIAFAF